MEASLKARQMGMALQKVFLVVKKTEIVLIDRDTSDVTQNTLMQQVTFSGVNPTDKKQFGYITQSRAGLLYCHVFIVKGGALEIPQAIGQAFTSNGGIAASSSSPPQGNLRRLPSTDGQTGGGVPMMAPQPGATRQQPAGRHMSMSLQRAGYKPSTLAGGAQAFDAEYLGKESVPERTPSYWDAADVCAKL